MGGDKGFGTFLVTIGKVLVENCAQLWLQASYFAVVFEHTSHSAKLKLLASIGLGCASALHKSLVLLASLDDACLLFGAVSCVVLIFAMVAWTCAKLYFSYVCESHMWNLTSGCVPAI